MNRWLDPEAVRKALSEGDGRGVRVAVLDSGVEIGHADFPGRQLRDDVAVGDDGRVIAAEPRGSDAYGHGTAVAGMVWRTAPGAEIGSFRVFGPNLSARTAAVSAAAEAAIRMGYEVLNCSFSCGLPAHVGIYKKWLDAAYVAGVHVVAAADSQSGAEWPAHFPQVIGVRHGSGEGDGLFRAGVGLAEFSVECGDANLPWNHGGKRRVTGSSFAAASMTGLVARILSLEPTIDVLQLKAILRAVSPASIPPALLPP